MIPMAIVVGSPSRLPGIREKEEEERAENKDDCFGYSFNSLSLLPRPIDPLNEISCPAGRRHAEISWSRVGSVYLCLRFSIETASPRFPW